VVHPRVPAKLREALQQAFIALGSRADAAPLLDGIQIPVPVKATYADYAPLEKLGLERYVVLKED
jgi:ABC-type phosphate/phosphonate transport system substrate-binding protein